VLYGNRDGSESARQDRLPVENLGLAFDAAEVGVGVLVQALSGADRYPLRTSSDVVAVLDRLDRLDRQGEGPGARMLRDVYDLPVNGRNRSRRSSGTPPASVTRNSPTPPAATAWHREAGRGPLPAGAAGNRLPRVGGAGVRGTRARVPRPFPWRGSVRTGAAAPRRSLLRIWCPYLQ
jgi:hypothetical protein